MKLHAVIANVILFSGLSWCSFSHAATECLFQDTMSVDLKHNENIVLDLSKTSIPDNGYVSVSPEYEFTSTGVVRSTCNNGQDGQVLQARDQSAGEDLSAYTTIDGKQVLMYKTTIKGLYYSVGIINTTCVNNSGYIPPDQSYTFLHDVGDDLEKDCMKNDTPWKFKVMFFIGSNYNYIPGLTFHSDVLGNHGAFRLSGSAGDVDPRNVTVKTVQINGDIE